MLDTPWQLIAYLFNPKRAQGVFSRVFVCLSSFLFVCPTSLFLPLPSHLLSNNVRYWAYTTLHSHTGRTREQNELEKKKKKRQETELTASVLKTTTTTNKQTNKRSKRTLFNLTIKDKMQIFKKKTFLENLHLVSYCQNEEHSF